MSKQEMPSIDWSKGMAEPSMNSYQSVWMAHWKVAKLSPPSKPELLSLNHMAREIASDSTSGLVVTSSLSYVPKMDNQFCEVPAKNTVNIVDVVTNTVDIMDGKTVAIASQYLAEEGPISTPSHALSPPQRGGASFPVISQRGSTFSYHEAWTPLAMHSFPKNRIEGSGDVSKQPFESDNIVGKKSAVFSAHYQESPLGSTSRQVPHSLDAEGNSLTFSTDKFDHHASMATPSLWNRAASLLQSGYTPTSQKRPLTYPAENSRKVYHHVLPSEKSPLEVIKCKTSCYEHSSRPSHNVVDVMTARTHTFVDSKRLAAGQMKFSQTMHQLFFNEKTDIRTSKRSQNFRESTVRANYQGNSTFGQFLSLSTDGNYYGNPGVKLQPLWSSTDSEGHENLADVKTSAVAAKNKLSAKTNTLDMDALAGKHLSGEASSSPPKKDALAGKVIGSLAKAGSSGMKREFLTLVTMSSSTDDREPSPSKTQSLEVDHLLPHDDQGTRSNPEAHAHCSGLHEPEQRDGRMKQLKATDSDQLRESLKSGQASPVREVNDLFGRISKRMRGILQPDVATGSSECAPSAKGGESTSFDKTMGGKGRGALLSDPWIRRWCRHKTTAVLRKKQEPASTKAFDELQKKPLPSVAAMALMGKAMNRFHPCEFTRRGSLVVWKS